MTRFPKEMQDRMNLIMIRQKIIDTAHLSAFCTSSGVSISKIETRKGKLLHQDQKNGAKKCNKETGQITGCMKFHGILLLCGCKD